MTLCDLLGEHGTLLPVVTTDLHHVGYRCGGCGAQGGIDAVLPAPAGLRCLHCGDRLADQTAELPAFCSLACERDEMACRQA